MLSKNLFDNKISFSKFPSMEAQVAAISDDIAYNNHDLEDGLRAGLFTIDNLLSIPFVSKLIRKHVRKKNFFREQIIINQIVRELINYMVIDVIETSKKNIKRFKIKNIQDVYNQNSLIVDFSSNMKKVDKQIKNFLRVMMYNNKKVLTNTIKGKKIIKKLFNFLSKNPNRFINNSLSGNDITHRDVADFIAGMTDRYAINLYNKIK